VLDIFSEKIHFFRKWYRTVPFFLQKRDIFEAENKKILDFWDFFVHVYVIFNGFKRKFDFFGLNGLWMTGSTRPTR